MYFLNGVYYTGSTSAAQTVTSWLAPSSFGYITTVYDQSGNGKDATQGDTSLQGKFNPVDALIDFTGGNYFMNMHASSFNPGDSPYSWVVSHGVINNNRGGIFGVGSIGDRRCINVRTCNDCVQGQITYLDYWWANDYAFGQYTAGNVVSETYDLSNRRAYINGALVKTQPTSNHELWIDGQPAYLGHTLVFWAPENLDGQIHFLVIANTALSDSDRQLLERC